jgi:hypothetical protein
MTRTQVSERVVSSLDVRDGRPTTPAGVPGYPGQSPWLVRALSEGPILSGGKIGGRRRHWEQYCAANAAGAGRTERSKQAAGPGKQPTPGSAAPTQQAPDERVDRLRPIGHRNIVDARAAEAVAAYPAGAEITEPPVLCRRRRRDGPVVILAAMTAVFADRHTLVDLLAICVCCEVEAGVRELLSRFVFGLGFNDP